jgi:hypothetical protein
MTISRDRAAKENEKFMHREYKSKNYRRTRRAAREGDEKMKITIQIAQSNPVEKGGRLITFFE